MLLKSIILVLFSICIPCIASAQQAESKANLSDIIPFNQLTRKVTLPNGFSYYISKNTSEPGKVYTQFTVKAGEFQADKNQTLEIPHLMEHIVHHTTPSLNGYQQRGLIPYLLVSGAKFNAHPKSESTCFYATVNSDTVILKNLFSVYKDWVSNRTVLKKKVIEAEKNIVIAEKIRGEMPTQDVEKQLFHPSKFAETKEWLADLTLDKIARLKKGNIRRFHSDWYRPDLSGLIVVGDIDVDYIERLIQGFFSGLQNPSPKRSHVAYPLKFTGHNKYIVETNASREDIQVEFLFLKERTPRIAYADLKDRLMADVFNIIVEKRMRDRYGNNNTLVKVKVTDESEGEPMYRSLTFRLKLNKGKFIEAGLKTLFAEAEIIKRFGFTIKELTDARDLRLLELKSMTESLPDEALRYAKNFVNNEAAPSKKILDSLRVLLLNGITADDLQQFTVNWLSDRDRSIVVRAPETETLFIPTESNALAWLNEIQKDQVLSVYKLVDKKEEKKIYTPKSVNFDSLYNLPKSGGYVRQDFPIIGITELYLSNGIHVVLKKETSHLDSKVYLEALRPVGASGFDNAKYFSARLASQLNPGLGELSGTDLLFYKEIHDIKTDFAIRDRESVIRGNSSEDKLEILLQLAWRYFLKPRRDTAFFDATIKEKCRQALRSRRLSTLHELLGRRVLSPHQLSKEELNSIQYSFVLESYAELFSTASEFTFIIAGIKDIDTTVELVSKYLGSLPERKSNSVDLININQEKPNVNKKVINRILNGTRQGANVLVIYSKLDSSSLLEEVRLKVLTKVLEFTCFDRLREKEHGVYSITSEWGINKSSDKYLNYEIKLGFECLPAIRNRLIKAVREEVESLKRGGPKPEHFKRAIDELMTSCDVTKWSDIRWAGLMIKPYEIDRDYRDVFKMETLIKSVTPNDIQMAAQMYLRKKNFTSYSEIPHGRH